MKQKSKFNFKTPLAIFICAISLVIGVNKTKALIYDTSYYDAISWIYEYEANATWAYNCLGWATGSMSFDWPSHWGEEASNVDVTIYLGGRGYRANNIPPILTSTKIIAYGPGNNRIVHFAKISSSKVTSKWGSLERFSHLRVMDPYLHDGPYGAPILNFS